ncbi:MAG TPA: single-stranded DNA-binding protein [Sumerlaeia bacterium]|nr:single-stranded DNA-binding protein [Sumerlaeia bacterium]
MLEMNKVMLIGNLTRDPELTYTSSGTALAKVGLAVNRSWKDRTSGERKEDTAFVDIDVWGQTAEFCSKYLAKGRRVYVEGRLRFDQWETSDGQKRSKLAVTAERVQFADSRPTEGQQSVARGGSDGGEQASSPPAGVAGAPPPQAAPGTPPASPEPFPCPEEPVQDEATADDLPF